MTIRHLRYPGWAWYVLLPSLDQSVDAYVRRELPMLAGWLASASDRTVNHIAVSELLEGEPSIHGTLMIEQPGLRSQTSPLHFWTDRSRLVLLPPDAALVSQLQLPPWQSRIERCASAPEALFVLLQALLDEFHEGLDHFEQRLSGLEQAMQSRNRADLLDEIFERRYELLHRSHLFMPIREIEGAAREAFLETITDTEPAQRLQHRIQRIESLLQHYSAEIDTLISMDDAIASFRGNDIMKTLTIFTALFTPATVAGALWGMNFRRIPWSTEPIGFLLICAVVTAFTLAIYLWLWRKGWTGDLLLSRRRRRATEARQRSRKLSPRRRADAPREGGASGRSDAPRKSIASRETDASRQGDASRLEEHALPSRWLRHRRGRR